jgi:hypothetical protein
MVLMVDVAFMAAQTGLGELPMGGLGRGSQALGRGKSFAEDAFSRKVT